MPRISPGRADDPTSACDRYPIRVRRMPKNPHTAGVSELQHEATADTARLEQPLRVAGLIGRERASHPE